MSDGASRCAACGAALPAAFPGGSVTCACGVRASVPTLAPAEASATPGGPYRAATEAREALASTRCPYCGHELPGLARLCPGCDVRLDDVRCARCFSLHGPGAFACGRCGQALALEPLFDAVDAPCPRCRAPLEAAASGDSPLRECPRCGGIFVPKDALAEILARAEVGGAVREPSVARPAFAGEVRYLPCPMCHASMNRVNFGRASGVIVDVCAAHGTWFDAGELTRAVAFASNGGLEKTRAREHAERRQGEVRGAVLHAEVAVLEERRAVASRVALWRDLLGGLFGW